MIYIIVLYEYFILLNLIHTMTSHVIINFFSMLLFFFLYMIQYLSYIFISKFKYSCIICRRYKFFSR